MPFDLPALLNSLSKAELAGRLVAVEVTLNNAAKKLADISDEHVDCKDCCKKLDAARDLVSSARATARGRTL